MQAVALLESLYNTLALAERKTLRDTLGDVKTGALNNTLPDTLLKEKADNLDDAMGDVKAKPSTRWPTPYNRQRLRQILTLRNVWVKALVDTLAEKVAKAKAKTPRDTKERPRH